MKDIVVGKNDSNYVRLPTRIEDAHHYKSLAEQLQRKYGKRYKENKRIHHRFRQFHNKAKNILEDTAKKIGKSIVSYAKSLNATTIFLEDLNKMIKNVKRLSKGFRDRLYLMQYHYMQYWIELQAKKKG